MLVVWIVSLMVRLFRAVAALLRRPRQQGAVLIARLRGMRLTRSRALARSEGARAEALAAEVRLLRAELRLARAERDTARAELAGLGTVGRWPWRRRLPPDDRFLRAKREFALRFHPDRLPRGAADRKLRVAMFLDYWQALQRIERGR